MTPPQPVVLVNLITLEERTFPSLTKAAAWCCVSVAHVSTHLNDDRPWMQWYWIREDERPAKDERIRQLAARMQSEVRPRVARQVEDLVSLRIDAHTTILVTPDKANEEYAEQYRQKLLKNSRKY